MKTVVIHITRNCNMICDYCYEKDKTSGNVPDEEIIDNLEKAFDLTKENDIQLEFLGGEPLLNIKAIEYVCEYIKLNHPEKCMQYLISTNGTIYSDEIVHVLNFYKINMVISIDGVRQSHNYCRHLKVNMKGTYDIVIDNALKYKETLFEIPIIHATFHKYNVSYLYEGIKSIYDKGFNKITVGIVQKWADENFFKEYIKQHEIIIKNLDHMSDLRLLPMMDEIDINNIKTPEYLSIKNNSYFLEIRSNKKYEDLDESLKLKYDSLIFICTMYKNYKLNN